MRSERIGRIPSLTKRNGNAVRGTSCLDHFKASANQCRKLTPLRTFSLLGI